MINKVTNITYSRPKYQVFNLILLGFLLFGIKEFAEVLFHSLQSNIALLGLILIFGAPCYFMLKFKVANSLNKQIEFIFYIFLIYIMFIIFRPFINGEAYSDKSLHPYMIFGLTSYLLPFVVLLGTKPISLNYLFKFNYIFAIIGFVFFVVNFRNMLNVMLDNYIDPNNAEIPIYALANKYYFWFSTSSISLLCFGYIKNKKHKWIGIISSVFLLLLMTYFARRGGIFMSLMFFIGAFYLYTQQAGGSSKKLNIMMIILSVIVIALYIFINSNSTFSLIFERISQDSRSEVDKEIINYLNDNNAWWFGKGIEGSYPSFEFDEPRYVHETGYLHLILKGGIFYLALYVFLLLHAAYVGFFKSNNNFIKGFALYAFYYVIFLIPFGVPSFGLEYLLVWISFSFCESKKWRLMKDNQVKFYLSNK